MQNSKRRRSDLEWDNRCFREVKRALKVNQNINIFMAPFCGSCGQRQHILWMSIHLSDTHLGGVLTCKICFVFPPLHINTNDVLSQMRTNQGFSRRVLTDQVYGANSFECWLTLTPPEMNCSDMNPLACQCVSFIYDWNEQFLCHSYFLFLLEALWVVFTELERIVVTQMDR